MSFSLLFCAEAILSGADEGSLSSESDESDDEHDCIKGRWYFLCFAKMSNLRLYWYFVQP